MQKEYIKPVVGIRNGTVYGLPTVVAVAAVAGAVGAAAVAVGKAVGDSIIEMKSISNKEVRGILL